MKRILFTLALCLIVCASCRHIFYDREGVVAKVKIEHSPYKGVTYSYKNIVTTEFKNICDFIVKVDNNEYPQEVSLLDRNDYVIYTAVIVDRIPKLKQLLKRSEINNEIKRLKEIVKNGGAYYYGDMLNELKNFDGDTPKVTDRYYITD